MLDWSPLFDNQGNRAGDHSAINGKYKWRDHPSALLSDIILKDIKFIPTATSVVTVAYCSKLIGTDTNIYRKILCYWIKEKLKAYANLMSTILGYYLYLIFKLEL